MKLTILTACCILCLCSYSQPGSLDSSFGINGSVTTSFDIPQGVMSTNIVAQKDGKIILGGFTNDFSLTSNFALARYLPNGTLDSSFGINGKVITHFTKGLSASNVVRMSMLENGKIIAAGWLFEYPGVPTHFALAQYTSSGILDSTFGINGQVMTNIVADDALLALAIQKDGKILAGGSSLASAVVIRYNSNGTVDSSFGNNGLIKNDFNSQVNDIVIQSDDKIITSTSWKSPDRFQLQRYHTNGSLDSSFGFNGKTVMEYLGSNNIFKIRFFSIALSKSGNILAAGGTQLGNYSNNIILLKYKNNGILDSTFGLNGKTVTGIGGHPAFATQILLQPDNKIIVGGYWGSLFIARFKENGIIDSTYGTDGSTATYLDLGGLIDLPWAGICPIAIQPDGKIVATGTDYYNFKIARYKGDQPLTIAIKKNVSVTEGTTGITVAGFKIILNKTSPSDVFVDYTTKNLNALAGSDYAATSGRLRIKAGKIAGNIFVNILGDNTREANEKFSLVLSNPVNAVLGYMDSAICTIKNDDPAFALANATQHDQIASSPRIQLYPNPAKDVLHIRGLDIETNNSITITDISGVCLFKYIVKNNEYSVNIKSFAARTYLVKIQSNSNITVIPFLKE